MNIEEINSLIEEIEKDKVKAALERKKREKIRRRKEKERNQKIAWYQISSFLGFSFFSIVCSIFLLIKNYEENKNVFSNREVVIDADKVDDICDDLEEELGISIPEEENEDYLVLSAIQKNSHLSKEEKEDCYGIIPIIEDNPYLNKENAYQSLKELCIKHMNRPKGTENEVLGEYLFFDYQINIYDEDIKKTTFFHELTHCIYGSMDHLINLPRFLKEGMTELLTCEYFFEDTYYKPSTYFGEVLATKMLCEVVGENTVLESFSTGNMNPIYQRLATLSNSTTKEAKENIDKLDDLLDKRFNTPQKNHDIWYDFIDVSVYFDKCIKKNFEFYNYYVYYLDDYFLHDYIDIWEISNKVYFNQELKQKIGTPGIVVGMATSMDKNQKQFVKNKKVST